MSLPRKTPLGRGAKPLAPGKPLARSKSLDRGTTSLARTPMARTPGPARKAPSNPAKASRKTGASTETRTVVIERDGGTCQRCGKPGNNIQHREGRGMGGRGKADTERTNGPAWLVVLCGLGNTSGCHKEIDSDPAAEADGWIIRRNTVEVDATVVPIRTYQGWRRLTADGRSLPCGAPLSA